MKCTIFYFLLLSCTALGQLLINNNGPCSCDVTSNKCDPNCCCDTICTSIELASFSCKDNQISPSSLQCFSKAVLFMNNTEFTATVVGDQYCVHSDNYSLRNFYYPPTALTVSAINNVDITNNLPNYQARFSINLINKSFYKLADTIFVVVENKSVGYLGLSRPNDRGHCVNGSPVEFLRSESISCLQSMVNLVSECSKQSSVTSYLPTGALVATYPAALLVPYPAVVPHFVNIDCLGGSACNSSASPGLNSSGSGCANVLTDIQYVITVTNTRISAVTVNFSLATVTAAYRRSFSVSFRQTGLPTTTVSQRSGNPGYLDGMPVLVAKDVTSGVATVSGSMVTLSSGQCNSTGNTVPVQFGQNYAADCNINIPGGSGTVAGINSLVWGLFSGLIPSYVAPYGNTLSSNPTEFVRPVLDPYSVSSPPTSKDSLLSGQTVYLVFARTGTLSRPQNKLIGLRINYTFTAAANLSNLPQSMWISTSVIFVDGSKTNFTLETELNKVRSRRSVRDFFYLLYVENNSCFLCCSSIQVQLLLSAAVFYFI